MEAEIQKLQELLDYNEKVINALKERLKDIQKVAQESTYFAKDNDIPFSSVVKHSQSVRGEKDQDINPEDIKHKYIPEDTYTLLGNDKSKKSKSAEFRTNLPDGFYNIDTDTNDIIEVEVCDGLAIVVTNNLPGIVINSVVIGKKRYPFIQSII